MCDPHCFLCLEIIVSSAERSQASSSQTAKNPNDSINLISEEFWKFCKAFLQTETNGGKLWEGVKEGNANDDKRKLLCFCQDCQVLVDKVVKLYEARNVIEVKLLWKLHELKGVMMITKAKGSNWTVNGHGGRKKTMEVEVLRGSDWEGMVEFRKALVNKCTAESSLLFPVVILNKTLGVQTGTPSFVQASKYNLDFVVSLLLIMALMKGWNLGKLCGLRFLPRPQAHPYKMNILDDFKLGGALPSSKLIPYKSSHTLELDTDIPLKSNSIRGATNIRQRNRKRKQNISLGRKNIKRSDLDDNCSRRVTDADPIWSPAEDNVDAEEMLPDEGTVRDKVGAIATTSDVIIIKDELDLDNDNDRASNGSITSLNEVDDRLSGISVLQNEALVSETLKDEICVNGEKQNMLAENNLAEEAIESGDSYQLRKRSAPKHIVETETEYGDDYSEDDECKPKTKGEQKRSMETVTKKARKSKDANVSRKKLSLHKLKHKKAGLIQQEPFNYQCKLCNIRVGSSFQLYDHIVRKHHGGPEKLDFICKICNTKLLNSIGLVKHLRELHEDVQQKSSFCPFCSESFTTCQYMDLHIKRSHWKQHSLLFCDDNECRKSFFSIDQLNSHMKEDPSHQNRELFHCEICNRAHFAPLHLQLHRLNHIPKADRRYHCPHGECIQGTFRIIATLVNHYNTHHIRPEDRIHLFSCQKCKHHQYTFNQGEFEHHVNNFHANKPQFRCHTCDQEWPTFLEKRRHMGSVEHLRRAVDAEQKESLDGESMKMEEKSGVAVAPQSNPLTKCDICEHSFTSKLALRLHRKTEHPTAPLHYSRASIPGNICETCGKVFHSPYHLKRHKSVHADSQYECSQCGKLFRRKDHLKIHVNRFHTKEKVLVCDVCGRPCATKSELNYHKKEHELLHSCHVCRKKFSRGCTLQYHMRIHTGEKLQCEWCPAQYAALGNIKSHVKSVHPEEYQRHYGNTNQRTLLKYRVVQPGENEGPK